MAHLEAERLAREAQLDAVRQQWLHVQCPRCGCSVPVPGAAARTVVVGCTCGHQFKVMVAA